MSDYYESECPTCGVKHFLQLDDGPSFDGDTEWNLCPKCYDAIHDGDSEKE